MMVVNGRPAKNFVTYSIRSTVASGTILQQEETHTIRVLFQAAFELFISFIMQYKNNSYLSESNVSSLMQEDPVTYGP